jgi:starch synthase
MAVRSKLKVLFASSEVEPYSKTGGLADVAGSLPVALNKSGVDIRVVTPKYKCVKVKGNEASLGGKVPVYFIENDGYFMRDGLYAENGEDYGDNLDRFVFFSKQVLEIIRKKKFKPDIIHCNDWQTALVPLYLKEIFWPKYKFYKGIKTLITVHNLGYQGIFPKLDFPRIQLGWEYFTMHRLEFYDMVNLLKGGLVFSDFISTVSPAYAEEIQTGEFGCGLDP